MMDNVLSRKIRDGPMEAPEAPVQDKEPFFCKMLDAPTATAKIKAELERHVESWKLGRPELGSRDVMDPEPTPGNDVYDLLDPRLACIAGLEGAPRLESGNLDREHGRLEERLVVAVKGTVEKDVLPEPPWDPCHRELDGRRVPSNLLSNRFRPSCGRRRAWDGTAFPIRDRNRYLFVLIRRGLLLGDDIQSFPHRLPDGLFIHGAQDVRTIEGLPHLAVNQQVGTLLGGNLSSCIDRFPLRGEDGEAPAALSLDSPLVPMGDDVLSSGVHRPFLFRSTGLSWLRPHLVYENNSSLEPTHQTAATPGSPSPGGR